MEISVVNSRTSIRTLLEAVSFDRKHIDRGVIASPGFLGVQEGDETKFTSREWSRLGSSVLIVGRFLVFRVRSHATRLRSVNESRHGSINPLHSYVATIRFTFYCYKYVYLHSLVAMFSACVCVYVNK